MPGLVGLWHFDEGNGTTAADSSDYGNDGTIHGATWTTGKPGSALKFDGNDDYVDCGNDPSLDIDEEITIMAWVKPNSTNVLQIIAGKSRLTSGPKEWGIFIYLTKFYTKMANGTANEHINSDSTYTAGNWYHVAAIRQ